MDSGKREDLFNLALSVEEVEREKSLNLNVGYEKEMKTWELIVKYSGSIQFLEPSGIKVEELILGYAILTVPEDKMEVVTKEPSIEYIEKPKRFFYNISEGNEASNVVAVRTRELNLSGKGVIVAVIDSGIDYANKVFRKEDGTTRILDIWDQTIIPNLEKGYFPPEGFEIGVEFNKDRINDALATDSPIKRQEIVPSVDLSGHGTKVTAVAAGNGDNSVKIEKSLAYDSDILVVKLGKIGDSFPQTTELMRGLTYTVKKALAYEKPVVINLSFGNNYGAHDGTSLIERFIDNISEIGKTTICIANGNEGDSGGHYQGELVSEIVKIPLAVSNFESTINVQLWKNYVDKFQVLLKSPSGEEYKVDNFRTGSTKVILEQTEILIYKGEPTPYSASEEIYFDFIPIFDYINEGIWEFQLKPMEIVTGRYYLYLPSARVRNKDTKFLLTSPDITLTIPATSTKAISVGAYNTTFDSYASFSGRGYRYIKGNIGESVTSEIKPDLAAPGVNIKVPNGFGGVDIVSGTSFAVPFVSGAAALLMEWGIVLQNDPYLYGEKVKAYLRKGAAPLQGEQNYPNEKVGYGKLDLAGTFENIRRL